MALWHLLILCPWLKPTDPCIQNRNICSRQSKGQHEMTHKETKKTLHAQTIVHSILLTMIRFQKKNSFWKTVNYGCVLLSLGYDTICQVVTYPSWRWNVHKWMPTAVTVPALGCWQQNGEEDLADTHERGQEKPRARATSVYSKPHSKFSEQRCQPRRLEIMWWLNPVDIGLSETNQSQKGKHWMRPLRRDT